MMEDPSAHAGEPANLKCAVEGCPRRTTHRVKVKMRVDYDAPVQAVSIALCEAHRSLIECRPLDLSGVETR